MAITPQQYQDFWGENWGANNYNGQNQKAAVVNDFQSIFGRMPTQAEAAQLLPSYGNDPHVPDFAGGKSQVAALFQQQQNNPQKLYADQQNQYLKDAPKFNDQVTQTFQQNLGRAPTQDELTHFGALMASGQDPYQINQALQQTPEFQQQQTKQFTDKLGQQLQGTNADYFSKYIMPSIQANNAMAGRTQDSSGYQAQLANAAQQQNYTLQDYLAQVASSNYGQSTQNAASNYNQLLNQQYGLQNANVSNTLANQAANQQYNQGINMFNMQQQAYNRYLQQYGNRNNGWTTASNVIGLVGALANPATAFGGLYQNSKGGGGGASAASSGFGGGGMGGYGGTPAGLI